MAQCARRKNQPTFFYRHSGKTEHGEGKESGGKIRIIRFTSSGWIRYTMEGKGKILLVIMWGGFSLLHDMVMLMF
jgi:hypothetical protein